MGRAVQRADVRGRASSTQSDVEDPEGPQHYLLRLYDRPARLSSVTLPTGRDPTALD